MVQTLIFGFTRRVVLAIATSVSKEPIATINISAPKMEAVGSSETLINTSNITWRVNPEDQHLNLHRHESLKILTNYVPDGQYSIPNRERDFSVDHQIQTGSWAYPISYPT
jgi:hypothetical protein